MLADALADFAPPDHVVPLSERPAERSCHVVAVTESTPALTWRYVPPAGVEPATWWVEATRSIQLSYRGVCPRRAAYAGQGYLLVLPTGCAPYVMLARYTVAVAQLVRAPGCGPGGRGFKSPRSPRSAKPTPRPG